VEKKMSNLYAFEMLILLRVDDLKHANKKEVKRKNKKINSFVTKAEGILNYYAKPHLAVFPLNESLEVQYEVHAPEGSLIRLIEEEINNKCEDENIYPLVISNARYACSYRAYPKKIEEKIDKIIDKIKKNAIKYDLHGDFYAVLFESERDYKGFISGYQQTGRMRVAKSYSGSLI
jgi:hypothetical protein